MKRQQTKFLALVLVAALCVAACTDKDLETVARSLQVTSQALGTLQGSVLSGNVATPKLISDDATRSILEVCIKINEAGLETSRVTRTINALSPTDRVQILAILDPVIKAVEDALTGTSSLGITDIKTRDAVTASLLLIQTSLNSAKLVLAAR